MSAGAYPVPVWLPRRRRIVSPAEWLREKLAEQAAERESTLAKAVAFDKTLGFIENTASLVTSGAAVASSRVFCFVGWYSGTPRTVTGFSAGGGLTWVVDAQYNMTATVPGVGLAICSADAPSGLAISTTLTPTFSGSLTAGPGISACAFTGLATGATGYVDVVAAGNETSTATYTTGNLVTTNADDLLICMAHSADWDAHAATGTGAGGVGGGTELHDFSWDGGLNHMGTQYRIVAATGTYTLTGTFSSGGLSWQANRALAYKAAAAAAGQEFRPDADTDAAGWTTTPLHSKLSDESDSTFVTDGLV